MRKATKTKKNKLKKTNELVHTSAAKSIYHKNNFAQVMINGCKESIGPNSSCEQTSQFRTPTLRPLSDDACRTFSDRAIRQAVATRVVLLQLGLIGSLLRVKADSTVMAEVETSPLCKTGKMVRSTATFLDIKEEVEVEAALSRVWLSKNSTFRVISAEL